MALLYSDAVQVAPLRLCFYLLFYLLLLSLFTHTTSALITYDKGTLLDIGNCFTNLVHTLSPNPSWPLEILRNAELLLLTFHHRQTPAWLCLNFTMCSAATSTSILTLPLSSRGTLTKPTSDRSCRTFTNMYPVQLEDRIHWIIATLSLRMPTKPAHYRILANRTMPPFSSHRNTNKGLHRNPR